MKECLNLHNDINEVQLLGEWVEMLGEKYSLPMPAIFQLNLALEEAVVNVMSYAYPGESGRPVMLSAENFGNRIVFNLEDEGIAFDPTSKEEPDITLNAVDRPIGGLGIFLVKQLMKEVSYSRLGNRNILTMVYEAN